MSMPSLSLEQVVKEVDDTVSGDRLWQFPPKPGTIRPSGEVYQSSGGAYLRITWKDAGNHDHFGTIKLPN